MISLAILALVGVAFTQSCKSTANYGGGSIANPGFENGLTGWTQRANDGNFTFGAVNDGLAFEGCSEYSATPVSDTASSRSLWLTSSSRFDMQFGSYYQFNVFLGFANASNANMANPPNIWVIAGQNQALARTNICASGCKYNGTNGGIYAQVQNRFQSLYNMQGAALSIQLTWPNGTDNVDVVLDDVYFRYS